MLTTIVAFVVVLGLLVLVHEWGHFISARKAGLKVEEFGFGFPPRLFGFKRGETTYSLNLIPFGGFVKILGEGGEEKDNKRSFASREAGVRSLVVAAGVLMNFFLAFVLLVIVNIAGTTAVVDPENPFSESARISEPATTITMVAQDSPAEASGLRSGDKVLEVEGEAVVDEQHLIDRVAEEGSADVSLLILRGDENLAITIAPRADPPDGEGPLGIGMLQTVTVQYPWYQAIWEGAKQTVFMTAQIFIVFGRIIRDLFTTGSLGADIAGPVGIAVLTGQVLDLGIVPLLQFTALLSINLGIINALPIPALDGGRLLFILIEKIRRKKISKKVENIIHSVSFVVLIILVAIITFRDLFRFNVFENIKNLFS